MPIGVLNLGGKEPIAQVAMMMCGEKLMRHDTYKEFEKWIPKVKSGGIISGHDFSQRFRKYANYIKNYMRGQPIKVYGDNSWYYIKE